MNEWMREDLNFNRRMRKIGCCLLVLFIVLMLLIFSLAIPLLRKLGHGESNWGRFGMGIHHQWPSRYYPPSGAMAPLRMRPCPHHVHLHTRERCKPIGSRQVEEGNALFPNQEARIFRLPGHVQRFFPCANFNCGIWFWQSLWQSQGGVA